MAKSMGVPKQRRQELYGVIGAQFKQMADDYSGQKPYGLGQPGTASCRIKLAEGGGACSFSNVFV